MALVCLDDVLVFGRNFDKHLKQLELDFKRLAENGLKIKGPKSNFLNQEKARALERVKEPSSLKDVRDFLGLVGYYRNFIPGFGKQQNLFTVYRIKKIILNGVQSAKVR